MTVKPVTPQSTTRKPTAKASTNKLRTRVVKTMLTADEKQRFADLVRASCLSQAEFVRRACLRQSISVVPDQNLTQYATLGQLQGAVQAVLRGELPESSRAALEAALETLKAIRLLLIDVDATAVVEPASEAAATTTDAAVYEPCSG